MQAPVTLEQVVVVPRNGLGNRLQAWASAAILAAEWDVPLKIMWEPEAPAPATAQELFTPEAINRTFVDRAWLDEHLGQRHENLPRYLTVDHGSRSVILAGHDRGEQVFMPDLGAAFTHRSQPRSLIIIAGGLFHLPAASDFLRQRSIFYGRLPWASHLTHIADRQAEPHRPYCALHIRQTDRSIQAPTASTIRASLTELADTVPERSLFIAADTLTGRESWASQARGAGFDVWTAEGTDFDRRATPGALSAAVDWMLLSQATGLAYPAASTFSAEAAVAAERTDVSIPMQASQRQQRLRVWRMHGRNALTYPIRHWRH